MKKIFNLMMATAIALGTFTACEDVPEPYTNPYDQMKPAEPDVVIEPEGDGTAANPWNVAALLEACSGLGSGDFLNGGAEVYARGIVTETTDINTQYKNATYYISDDKKGSNRFYVYRGKLLDGADVTSDSDLQPGDSVVVCGKVKNYGGTTLEFDTGNYLVFYKKGEGGNTPALEAPGTAEAPLTVAQALDYIYANLEADKNSPEGYVKGKIVAIGEVDTGQYGNATYTISDDGTDAVTLQIYRGYSLGGAKFTSANEIKAGDEVIVKGKLVNYKGNTPQFAQGSAIYSLNGKTDGGNDTPNPSGEAKGDGTLANPFNPIAANNFASALESGAKSDKEVYIKGKISRIANNGTFVGGGTYGNATFYISEDGAQANEFYVFRTLYLGNVKYTGGTDIAVGDDVIIYGKVMNYQGTTPETSANESYIYSLNGKTEGGNDTPTPTDIKKVTVAEFNAAAESSDVWYQLTGTVKNLKDGDLYGNFDLEDATGSVYVYGLLSEKGGEKKKFQELVAAKGIKEGSTITLIGNRGSYNDKIEVTNAYFVSIEGGNDNPNPTTGDDVAETGTNGNFEQWADGKPVNWTTVSTACNATLTQSTTAHGGSYSVQVGGSTSANKRLGYKEMTLTAGTYAVKFYAKALAEGGTLRPGFVSVTDGKASTTYNYIEGYIDNVSTGDWQLVEVTLDVPTTGTYCFVIMNQKKSSAVDILIDDFTVTLNGKTVIE